MKRLLIPVFLLLGACSSKPVRQPPPVIDGQTGEAVIVTPAEPQDQSEVVSPLPPASVGGGAVVALLSQAEDYHRAGDIPNEAATIERALRINARDARLWHRLAAVRLEQGRPGEAEQLALKSNALAGSNRALQADNWRLVARARWSLNAGDAARQAEQKARELGN